MKVLALLDARMSEIYGAAYVWEAKNGPHPLRLVAELGDRELAPPQRLAS